MWGMGLARGRQLNFLTCLFWPAYNSSHIWKYKFTNSGGALHYKETFLSNFFSITLCPFNIDGKLVQYKGHDYVSSYFWPFVIFLGLFYFFSYRMEWTGWVSWIGTNFMEYCVMTWDWARHFSLYVSWPVTTISKITKTRLVIYKDVMWF